MRRLELAKGVFFLLFSFFVCYEALHLPLGSFGKPGAGFFPLFLGIILALLSLLFVFIKTFGQTDRIGPLRSHKVTKRVPLTLGVLILYGILFPLLGYLLSTCFLVYYFLCMAYPKRWLFCAILSVMISLLFYFGFQTMLRIHLPEGILAI
jgi:putative tricarboxylic transport membrane protein